MTLLSEENIVRFKVVLYCLLFFFSFFAPIAVSITTNNVHGCFLYSAAHYFGSAANCDYVIAIPVIFQLIYGLLRLVPLILLMIGKLKADLFLFSGVFQLVFVVIDAVACFLVFVSACILSAGIRSTCNSSAYRYLDCTKIVFNGDDSATSRMHTAEAGAWISFVLWLILVVVGVFWLLRQGNLPCFRRPSSPQEEEKPKSAGVL